MKTDRSKWVSYPLISNIIMNRKESSYIILFLGLQIIFASFNLQGWPCPIKLVFGIPCPGCGLSTAIGYLLKGKWHAAVTTHFFAPIFFVGFCIITISACLPQAQREKISSIIGYFEQKFAISTMVLIGLFIYWGLRLLWKI